MRAHVPELHVLLTARGKNEKRQPWTELVTNDFGILYCVLPRFFGGMFPPWVDASPYWRMAADFPSEWPAIIACYHTHLDDRDAIECSSFST